MISKPFYLLLSVSKGSIGKHKLAVKGPKKKKNPLCNLYYCQNKPLFKKLLVGNHLKPLKYWVKSGYTAGYTDS